MSRRPSNLKDLFGDYLSTEAIESIQEGEGLEKSQQERDFEFVWIWFTDDQIRSSDVEDAMEVTGGSGRIVDVFLPVVALWFVCDEQKSAVDVSMITQGLKRFTDAGAKIIYGTVSGVARNIGSQTCMTFTVVSDDRDAILTQLAAAEDGTINPLGSQRID